jgi:hypothetical protein
METEEARLARDMAALARFVASASFRIWSASCLRNWVMSPLSRDKVLRSDESDIVFASNDGTTQ